MYRVGICGFQETENKLIQDTVRCYLQKRGIINEITVWGCGQELLGALQKGCSQDLLFLEAETEHFSGIELGHFIRRNLKDQEMQIVYVSADNACMERLFKLQPVDFFEKPVTKRKLKETMEMVYSILQTDKGKFRFQRKQGYCFVPYSKILYFAGEGRKIKIITVYGGIEEFYGKMGDVEKQLPPQFLEIHKSYIINKEFIFRYEAKKIELYGGTVINISKPNRKLVRDIIGED